MPLAIHADRIELQDAHTGAKQTVATAAVFIRAGVVPNTELFAGQLELDEASYIRVFENQRTSQPLVYAIGDVCKPVCLSVATAVGHAAEAVKDATQTLRA